MDFTPNRNAPASARTTSTAGSAPAGKTDSSWKAAPNWLKIMWLVLLFAGTILMAGIITLMIFGNGNKSENEIIDQDKYQAVFLDNNQVYFGKVKTVNDKYIDLQGIYYLTTDQSVQPREEVQQEGNIRLQPLGCELHGPENRMVINREHVTFWENLKKEGTVSQAIAQWLEQNPEGLDCDSNQASAGDDSADDSATAEEGQDEDQNREEDNQ